MLFDVLAGDSGLARLVAGGVQWFWRVVWPCSCASPGNDLKKALKVSLDFSKGKNLKNHTIIDFSPAGMLFDVLAGDSGLARLVAGGVQWFWRVVRPCSCASPGNDLKKAWNVSLDFSKGKNLKNHAIIDFSPAGMLFNILAGDSGLARLAAGGVQWVWRDVWPCSCAYGENDLEKAWNVSRDFLKGKNLKNHANVDFSPAEVLFDLLAGDSGLFRLVAGGVKWFWRVVWPCSCAYGENDLKKAVMCPRISQKAKIWKITQSSISRLRRCFSTYWRVIPA
jgi:uncharacterized membrane protein